MKEIEKLIADVEQVGQDIAAIKDGRTVYLDVAYQAVRHLVEKLKDHQTAAAKLPPPPAPPATPAPTPAPAAPVAPLKPAPIAPLAPPPLPVPSIKQPAPPESN